METRYTSNHHQRYSSVPKVQNYTSHPSAVIQRIVTRRPSYAHIERESDSDPRRTTKYQRIFGSSEDRIIDYERLKTMPRSSSISTHHEFKQGYLREPNERDTKTSKFENKSVLKNLAPQDQLYKERVMIRGGFNGGNTSNTTRREHATMRVMASSSNQKVNEVGRILKSNEIFPKMIESKYYNPRVMSSTVKTTSGSNVLLRGLRHPSSVSQKDLNSTIQNFKDLQNKSLQNAFQPPVVHNKGMSNNLIFAQEESQEEQSVRRSNSPLSKKYSPNPLRKNSNNDASVIFDDAAEKYLRDSTTEPASNPSKLKISERNSYKSQGKKSGSNSPKRRIGPSLKNIEPELTQTLTRHDFEQIDPISTKTKNVNQVPVTKIPEDFFQEKVSKNPSIPAALQKYNEEMINHKTYASPYQAYQELTNPYTESELYLNKFSIVNNIQDFSQKTDCSMYSDPHFPANLTSLYNNNTADIDQKLKKRLEAFDWARIDKIISKEIKLFTAHGVSPESIYQAENSPNPFFAALSALSERPERVIRLFKNSRISKNGKYVVSIFVDGLWKDIEVDSMIPCLQYSGRLLPAFIGSKNSEIWGMVLEKAFAKLSGGYSTIKNFEISQVLQILTGAPSSTTSIKNKVQKLGACTKEDIWKILVHSEARGDIVVAKTHSGANTALSRTGKNIDTGLLQSAGYTFLGCYEVKEENSDSEKKTKIVKLRNPWGNNLEWKLRWGKGSKEMTYEVAQELKMNLLEADGIFLMKLNDFLSFFEEISVSNFSPSYINNSILFKYNTHTPSVVQFRVSNAGLSMLQITHESQKLYKGNIFWKIKFLEKLRNLNIVILHQNSKTGDLYAVSVGRLFNEDSHIKLNLQPGLHFAYVKISIFKIFRFLEKILQLKISDQGSTLATPYPSKT